MNLTLKSLLPLAVLFTPCFGGDGRLSGASSQPNVIFILVDDLGYGDVGVFHQNLRAAAGDRSQPWHLTPALDRMAAQGMTLPHHYCPASVCAPSRASLLLGVHQGHANVRDNQFDKALEDNHTIATVLRQAGYKTAAIGKYGLQGNAKKDPPNWPAHPNRRGFDEYYGYIRHGDGHEHYPKNGITKGPKEVWENDREVSAGLDNCYTTDLFTARAKWFVAEHVANHAAEPFFLYLAYDTPHAVLTLPTGPYPSGSGTRGGLQWLGKAGHMINTANGTPDSFYHPDYADATWDDDANSLTPEVAWPDVQKRYATLVRRIDDCIADLYAQLSDLQIDDNTLVVFTTDNGPSLESYLKEDYAPTFFDSFGPHDGTKRDLWEGGVHVGALARWPAKIKAGSTAGVHATGFWDWLPTFAEAAGVAPPARSDGVSLLPLLTGNGMQTPSRIYSEYAQNGKTPPYDEFLSSRRGRKRNQMQLIREGNFVGVRYDVNSQSDDFEIYDVVADPGQRHDLAASMPELGRQMKAQVLRLRRPDGAAPRPYDDELIPSLAVASDTAGLQWQYASGDFLYVPATHGLNIDHTGVVLELGDALVKPQAEGVVVYRGYLNVPADGKYTFHCRTKTKAIMRLHEATVIDADAGYDSGSDLSANVMLAAGKHPITIHSLFESDAAGGPGISWSAAGAPEQPLAAEQLTH